MKVIYLEWLDAASISGWQKKEIEMSPIKCCTLGYVINETKDHITICHTMADEVGDVNGVFSIPKGWIRKRKNVKL